MDVSTISSKPQQLPPRAEAAPPRPPRTETKEPQSPPPPPAESAPKPVANAEGQMTGKVINTSA